jgi:hypothetical protein
MLISQHKMAIFPRRIRFFSYLEKWRNTPIGRWQITHNPKTISIKVYQANEDHCGCCQNMIPTKGQQSKDNENLEEEYYRYFCA